MRLGLMFSYLEIPREKICSLVLHIMLLSQESRKTALLELEEKDITTYLHSPSALDKQMKKTTLGTPSTRLHQTNICFSKHQDQMILNLAFIETLGNPTMTPF